MRPFARGSRSNHKGSFLVSFRWMQSPNKSLNSTLTITHKRTNDGFRRTIRNSPHETKKQFWVPVIKPVTNYYKKMKKTFLLKKN